MQPEQQNINRRQLFAERLLGDRFHPVPARYPPAPRTISKGPTVRPDNRLRSAVYKSECFICNQGCDAEVHLRDGQVVRVEGYAGSAITEGTLCSKGLASRFLLDRTKRLLYPMRRSGERGADQWERITWDEALDEVAGRLDEIEQSYGDNSIVLATGTNRGWVRYFGRFANAFRKQWMGPGIAQCFYPRMTAQMLLFGATPLENPHYAESRCLLVWGCNPASTWPVKAMGIMAARARGAKMIVVDPFLSETASKADLWLQLRPGTDAALALGMLRVIVEEDLIDHRFVETWCHGFGRLRERLAEYPLSRVEEITWVPAGMIKQAALLYAATKPASITECLSTDQNADTISTCRAMAMLATVTGNIDIPGGNVMSMPKKMPSREEENLLSCLSAEDHAERLGSTHYPLLSGKAAMMPPSAHNHAVWQAVLTGKPYPVKAIYCHGSNMLVSYPNTGMVRQALARLDFFVVADLFMTETARMADILLPAASWLERNSAT
jgi:anaerobic selenocysteine-containing dehydrogenase